MTAKKRKLIIIIVSAVLAVALILSLSLGLTLGRKANWSCAFTLDDAIKIKIEPATREIITTDVTVNDLSEDYRQKLSEFTNTDLKYWYSENIFRNFSGAYKRGLPKDRNKLQKMLNDGVITKEEYDYVDNYPFGEQFFDWQGNEVKNLTDYSLFSQFQIKSATDMADNYVVKYANGYNELGEGEILVSRAIYWYLYAREHTISIDIDKVHEILDDEDCLAKHAILRNFQVCDFGIDGMAIYHYKLVDGIDLETFDTTLVSDDKQTEQSYKIVGYFECADDNTIGDYKVQLDNNGKINGTVNFDIAYLAWSSRSSIVYVK